MYSLRCDLCERLREYIESDSLFDGAHWDKAHFWLKTDGNDKPNPYLKHPPQLYNINAVGYESVMLGMFDIHYGPENEECNLYGIPKITEIQPMFSRDGYHFSRPRQTLVFVSINRDCRDRGYVKSTCGGVIIHNDEL